MPYMWLVEKGDNGFIHGIEKTGEGALDSANRCLAELKRAGGGYALHGPYLSSEFDTAEEAERCFERLMARPDGRSLVAFVDGGLRGRIDKSCLGVGIAIYDNVLPADLWPEDGTDGCEADSCDGPELIRTHSTAIKNYAIDTSLNDAAEYYGAEFAINLARSLRRSTVPEGEQKGLVIAYDNIGVAFFAVGFWKASKPSSKAYAEFLSTVPEDFPLYFFHIKSHEAEGKAAASFAQSGNNIADTLATQAIVAYDCSSCGKALMLRKQAEQLSETIHDEES